MSSGWIISSRGALDSVTIEVATSPGQIAVARIPCASSSRSRLSVIPRSPNFDALYAETLRQRQQQAGEAAAAEPAGNA